ncbi:unnamed protein product [Orchesella dallaii]|uniref:Glycolipid transfer protein domain-containing protein n=1 Tax=Orchesella dallaii TaxID=48710 RepID=A0ABP1PZQ2_9HEXA
MKVTLDRWPGLSPDGKVPTREFLHCSNLVVRFIDTLGSAFALVSRDVNGNIKKVMIKYLQDTERYKYLQDIVEEDIATKNFAASEALLWLKRGLNFLCTFLQSIVTDYEENTEPDTLVTNLRSSYEATIAMYHGFLLRGIFNILLQASPSRPQLIQRLSVIVNEEDKQLFMSEVKTFYQGLRINLDALYAFYTSRNLFQ